MDRNQQLKAIVEQLYNNAPAFTQRLKDAGVSPDDIQSADDLAKIPVLHKDDLINLQKATPPFGGLLAISMGELAAVYQSPGPINEPMVKGEDLGNWSPALRAAGFKAGDVVINAFGYHMTPAGASLQSGLHTVGCVVIPGGIGNQEQQLQAMVQFGATGYVGLPSYLKALLDIADQRGYELQLDHALVLAEPFPPSLRRELQDRGVTALQAYGTAECGNLGYETPAMNGWHVPENVILQICDINSGDPLPAGETGEVVATLFNPHYAATVRFGVGDLSAIIPDSLTDGGPVRIAGWQGRVGAATKVRGMFLHPTQLASMMGRFGQVTAYQAVVTREDHRDSLALHVVVQPGTSTEGLAEQIQAAARENIKFRLQVNIVDADSIPAGSSPIRDERSWD